MQPTGDSSSDLYAQIVGSRWNDLDEAVRRLHETGMALHVTGTFRVRRGNNRLVRFLAMLGGLPHANEAVEMRLIVTRLEHGEEWRRSFAGKPMISTQWNHPNGLLVERMGPLQLRFQLNVVDGALGYQTRGVALCLGPLRIPLPSWLAPNVTAWEKPTGDPNRVQVAVESRLPILGMLISYEGTVTRTEADA
jgi:hypothetical protein